MKAGGPNRSLPTALKWTSGSVFWPNALMTASLDQDRYHDPLEKASIWPGPPRLVPALWSGARPGRLPNGCTIGLFVLWWGDIWSGVTRSECITLVQLATPFLVGGRGGCGAHWASRPKLRISTQKYFLLKIYNSSNSRSKNAPNGSKARLFDILYNFFSKTILMKMFEGFRKLL